MKPLLIIGFALSAVMTLAATNNYTVTILKPDPLGDISRLEPASTNLVGKSIVAIYGPVSEVRILLRPLVNRTGIEDDGKKLEQRIRERIDSARCLGRDAKAAWHYAPWVSGYIFLKDGRILPVEILLSGIVIDDLLFSEMAEPIGAANGASPRR